MQAIRATIKGVAEVIFLLSVAPFLLLFVIVVLTLNDLVMRLRTKAPSRGVQRVSTQSVSVVIPTWNGRQHLERNLRSVVDALGDNPGHEILVVDNASTDGTGEFLADRFPIVRVIALERNLGFGGGCNAGVRAARNDIVVLLNNDMRVQRDFLQPLLEGFSDPRTFAVSAQIFFSDAAKRREETGLTQGFWRNGRLSAGHLIDDRVTSLFPTFYAGGGSTAYDRHKFLELGGFDPLWEPFYLEDTDISYGAWKRGWTVLYQPRSVVYHDHRGTIGKHFSEAFIQQVLEKNHLLFAWKNIHEWPRLLAHFGWLYAGLWVRLLIGPATARPNSKALLRALKQFPRALRSRNQARQLAAVDDTEAFHRPLGGYFRDRFGKVEPDREKLNILFVSPYPIEPPLHGGALFMNQTVHYLAPLSSLYLLCLLDEQDDLATNQRLDGICAGTEFLVRWRKSHHGLGALLPHAAQDFDSNEFRWRIHRNIFVHNIDVVQFDYTQMAVYAAAFQKIATFLFEHDVYFQSVKRGIRSVKNVFTRTIHWYEYLRALRFELKALRRFDGIQVCTKENRRYLESFAGENVPVREDLRAAIDLSRYEYTEENREPDTLLFVGSFQHPPNQNALHFLVDQIFPLIRQKRPQVRLIVAGSQAPPGLHRRIVRPGIEFLGRVPDIRELYARYAVFVCPILSGSGVRVKLLEAFASGIPAVSTTIGAEGLTSRNSEIVELADSADSFAERTLALLESPASARAMARRARGEVEEHWSAEHLTRKLERYYRQVLREKNRPFSSKIENSTARQAQPAPHRGESAATGLR